MAHFCATLRRMRSPIAIGSAADLDPALADALATTGLPRVHQADGLDMASLPAASFDLVIGNPPYGVGGTRNGGTAPASEVRFLLRALELARPGGHVALVLPSGVLANQRLCAFRAELLAHSTVLAVIALPRETFRHTGTSAACTRSSAPQASAAVMSRFVFSDIFPSYHLRACARTC